MYFPCLGSHLTIIDAGSKTELVISVTSTFKAPSNLKEAVKEEIVWEINLFKLV